MVARIHLRGDKFIISAPARTGSTMLQRMLASHPDIVCHGEVMDQDRGVGRLTGRYAVVRDDPTLQDYVRACRSDRSDAFLYDVVFDAQGRQAVGFKFKTDEAFAGTPMQLDFNRRIAADDDIKVIRPSRRSLLDQLVSHELVRLTGHTQGAGEVQLERPAFEIGTERAVAYFEGVLRRERQADEAYAAHRQLLVTYEGLLDERAAAEREILGFLEVAVLPLEVSTSRIITDHRALVTNIDKLLGALEQRGFGAYLG